MGMAGSAPGGSADWGRNLVYPPAELPCTGAVVWLHGFGDVPEGWGPSFQQARHTHPQWKWVHLRGRELPQTCYAGKKVTSWGDYHDQGCTKLGSADYDNEDIVAEATVAEVHRVVDQLGRDDGVPPERVVIGGFSMGAAAAAETALRYPKRLAGLVVLNGWLLPGGRAALASSSPALHGLPVLVSHGSKDEFVALECAEAAVEHFRSAGALAELEVQDGLTHVASGFGPGRELTVRFLAKLLGPLAVSIVLGAQASAAEQKRGMNNEKQVASVAGSAAAGTCSRAEGFGPKIRSSGLVVGGPPKGPPCSRAAPPGAEAKVEAKAAAPQADIGKEFMSWCRMGHNVLCDAPTKACALCSHSSPSSGCGGSDRKTPCAACNCGLRVVQHNTFLTVEEDDPHFPIPEMKRSKSF
ncbi:unnamed protein product [Polarella glacialis]|uniref:Phospholipase/carboxylesterase/thioesterase domain-containing protein n=1 Tax=Polarella glacialis TaxID=89957 RepID=A0A813FNE4_POLGL|nr:unnamed protein product [Polarella glacialis]